MTATKTTVAVKSSATGERVGRIEYPATDYARYEAGEHRGFQWPEGIAEAGDVLTADQIEEFGITSRTVIWLD